MQTERSLGFLKSTIRDRYSQLRSRMRLDLPLQFSFEQFAKATPIDKTTVWPLLLQRNADKLPVKRQASALENLRRIVEATFKLANRGGFGAMTLRELSQEAGLSMGGLYGYITSKDDLASMLEDMIRHVALEIPAWFESHGEPCDRLDAVLRAHVFQSELLQPWFFFVFMESRSLSREQRLIAKTADLRLQQDLARLIGDSGMEDLKSAQLLAAHCAAMVQDWHVKRWKYRQLDTSADSFANSVCAFVWRAIRP